MGSYPPGSRLRQSRIERIHYSPDAPQAVIFIDSRGLPMVPLTAWYRLRGQRGPATTRQTYTAVLLPVLTYLADQAIVWNASPDCLRTAFLDYFADRLHCSVQPHLTIDGTLERVRLVATGQSPLAASSVRVVCAALRDFYAVLIDAKLYGYPNPLTSAVRVALAAASRQHLANRGAPDSAGIRGEERATSVRQPSALLAHGEAGSWRPDALRMRDVVLLGIQQDLEAMLAYKPSLLVGVAEQDATSFRALQGADARGMALLLRDRAILALLQYTGARLHEIVGLTVGGYRACGQVGWAKVVNKGSNGRPHKVIAFAGTPAQHALTAYLTSGRPVLDAQHCPHLVAVPDDEPLFLTQRGTRCTAKTWALRWQRLYERVPHACPVHFTPHDIRHWFVTRYLLSAKARCARDGTSYADAKALFSRVMGWANPETVEVYDHSLQLVEGWAQLVVFQCELATSPAVVGSPVPAWSAGQDLRMGPTCRVPAQLVSSAQSLPQSPQPLVLEQGTDPALPAPSAQGSLDVVLRADIDEAGGLTAEELAWLNALAGD